MHEFELDKASATLENLNLRVEKDGPDKIPAADLKLSVNTNADVLRFFCPRMKDWLFVNEDDLAGGTLRLRDRHLGFPLVRDEEMVGATARMDYGVGAPMVFADAKVNQFRLTAMDGGGIIVALRVQCRPTPDQIARLYELQERAVTLTIEPAELPKLKDAA